MTPETTAIIALVCAAVTAGIGFLFGQLKGKAAMAAAHEETKGILETELQDHKQSRAVLETKLEEKQNGFDQLREELVKLVAEKEMIQKEATTLTAELKGMTKLSEQRKKDLDELFEKNTLEAEKRNQQWTDKIQELTRKQVEDLQKRSEEKLGEKAKLFDESMKPMKEQFVSFTDRVDKLEKERKQDQGILTGKISGIVETHKELAKSTAKLRTVLSSSGARGKWGEMQLRNVVEQAGMLEYCDFMTEVHVTGAGSSFRPDMIINMSGGCKMIVDAKTPLDAYAKAVDAVDDATKTAELGNHVHAVRAHVKALAAKTYWEHVEGSPEYVILFMPAESIFYDALAHDPQLMDDALKQKVFIASPITLMALLRTGHAGWQMFKQNENIREIAKLGEDLYTRFSTFLKHLSSLGKKLDGAITSYNSMVGSYERSVEPCLRKFPELGIKSNAQLSPVSSIETPVRDMVKGPDDTEHIG